MTFEKAIPTSFPRRPTPDRPSQPLVTPLWTPIKPAEDEKPVPAGCLP